MRADAASSYLVADIGGTHARFALVQADGTPGPPVVMQTCDFADFPQALSAFIDKHAKGPVAAAAICGAGPVSDGVITMTNCPWIIDRRQIAAACGIAEVEIINDFTAIAHALPHLGLADLDRIGGGEADPAAPAGVLGAGTGLGVSGLISKNETAIALSGEGGHVGLSPASDRELEIFRHLLAERGRISAETILSGPGIATLYRTLAIIDGAASRADEHKTATLTAEHITQRAAAGTDARAVETLDLFSGWLGAVAGDLALTLGAKGGIYLAGGIAGRLGPLFNKILFRQRFEAKGRFESYMAAIPCYLITRDNPALIGLAALLRQSRDTAKSS